MLTQKLLRDGNIHRRSPSLEFRACWDGRRPTLSPPGAECSSDDGRCPGRGTSEARGGAEVVCGTYPGLCGADRRATIAPWLRGARRVAPEDHPPEVPRTAWHSGAGR